MLTLLRGLINVHRNSTNYSQLSPYGHPVITDTTILRTLSANPDQYKEMTENNSRYYQSSMHFVYLDNVLVLKAVDLVNQSQRSTYARVDWAGSSWRLCKK